MANRYRFMYKIHTNDQPSLPSPTRGSGFPPSSPSIAHSQGETHYIALAPKQPNVTPQACALAAVELATANVAKLSLFVFGDATYEDTINPHVWHHIEF